MRWPKSRPKTGLETGAELTDFRSAADKADAQAVQLTACVEHAPSKKFMAADDEAVLTGFNVKRSLQTGSMDVAVGRIDCRPRAMGSRNILAQE